MQSRINGVAGTLTGTLDNSSDNDFPGAGLPLSLLDTFALPTDKFGRIAGTFMNTGGAGPYFEYYLVDDNHGVFEETDLLTSGQVAIGYLAQACDVTSSTSCQVAAGASFAKRASKPSNSRNLNENRK